MLAGVLRLFASLLLVAVTATAAPTAVARASTPADERLTVAAGQSVVTPGTDLAVSFDLSNAGSTASSTGNVQLSLTRAPLDSASAVSGWLEANATDPVTGVLVSGPTLAVAPASTSSTSLTIPAAAFPGEGVWGILATWAAGTSVHQARTVVTVSSTPGQAEVSVLYALTPGTSGTGLLDAVTLGELTDSTGALTRQLDALVGKAVTVGLDPRILASIRALGSDAPASATAWLARLQGANLDTFLLQYADADPALQAQLGFAQLMTAGDFSDLENVKPAELAALTGWNANHSLLWPAASTVTSGDFTSWAASGYAQAVLGSNNVSSNDSPLVALGSATAVVAQSEASSALSRALGATTTTEWLAAVNQLQADLVFAAGRSVVLAPDRVVIANSLRAANTFDLLAGSAVSRAGSLAAVLGSTPSSASVIDQPESDIRLATGQHIVARNAEINTFSAVAVIPSRIIGPQHRNMMALFGTGWVTTPDEWMAAVGSFDAEVNTMLGAVHVVSSSTINLLAKEVDLPVTIENGLNVPVHVAVRVSPSNGRLVVGETLSAEVSAGARVTVRVPVKARIGNGPVALSVSLIAADGTVIGKPTIISANVQADWEGWGAGVLAAVAAGLFGFGIWRQIRRRRKAAAASGSAASNTVSDRAESEDAGE